jgi:hypothetical protein
MHGGNSGFAQHADLWRLNLTLATPAWTLILPFTGSFCERMRHCLAIEGSGDLAIGFGLANKKFASDTWNVDPSVATPVYTQLSMPDAPQNLAFSQAAYDPVGQRMIVFSGIVNGTQHSGLWQLDMSVTPPAWSPLVATGTPPSARMGATMVYDDSTATPRILMYGGKRSEPAWSTVSELWALELSATPNWVQLSPTSVQHPGIRSLHQAVLDGAGNMIVFGGRDEYGGTRNDTFALNLATLTWTRINTTGTPMARWGHGMVYDGQGGRNRLVMYGGYSWNGYMADTWQLDLNTSVWTQLSTLGVAPAASSNMTAVLDEASGRMLMYGGFNPVAVGGLYSFDLATDTWSQLAGTVATPQARWAHVAVWDTVENRMVVAGGYGGYAGYISNEIPLSEQAGAIVDTWFWGD